MPSPGMVVSPPQQAFMGPETEVERLLFGFTCRYHVPMASVAYMCRDVLAGGTQNRVAAMYSQLLEIRRRRGGNYSEVQLDTYVDTFGKKTGPRHLYPWFWRFRTKDDAARFSGEHPHPEHLAFDVLRQLEFMKELERERPAVLRAGLSEFPADEDVPFLLEWRTLCDYLWEKWRDLIYAPAGDAASATGGGRAVPKRDRVEFVQEALRELIKWRIIPDPFVIKDQDSSHDLARAEATKADAETVKKAVEAEAERDQDEHGKDEYLSEYLKDSPSEDKLPETRPHLDHQCPKCGFDGAVKKSFACRHTQHEGATHYSVVDDRLRAFVTLMHELRVSENVMIPLLEGAAKTFGIKLDKVPSRAWTQNILKEMAVLAKAEMGLTLYQWAKEDPQSLSVVIDAASIREKKFEGICFCKKVANLDVTAAKKDKYLRLGLGLIELSRGTDEVKGIALKELLSDCINCFNAVYAEEYGEELTMYHICRGIGYACNDHAESVVANKFLPFVSETMEAELGSIAAIKACLLKFVRHKVPGHMAKRLIIEAFSSDAVLLKRAKAERNAYFCANHRNQLGMDAALGGLRQLENQVEYAAHLPQQEGFGGQRAGGTLASRTIYSASKSIGRGKFHETYTHSELFSLIRDLNGAAKIHFERLLGARGNQAVYANAFPLLQAMLDKEEWGMLDFFGKMQAKKGTTNRLERDVAAATESNMLQAQLRVLGILHTALFRPIQTYVQSQASVGDATEALEQYAQVVEQLTSGPVHPRDLDWKDRDCGLLSKLPIAESPIVVHGRTAQLRGEAMAFLLNPPGLLEEDRDAQDAMMTEAMHYMGVGMAESLKRLPSSRYYKHGSILGLAADDPRRRDMAQAIGTSDPVERYFGLFSHLREANPNQTDENRDNQGAIIETKLGTKLVDLVARDPAAAARKIFASRRYAAAYHDKLADRKHKTLLDRKAELEEAEVEDRRKALEKEEELAAAGRLAEHCWRQAEEEGSQQRTRGSAAGGVPKKDWLTAELDGSEYSTAMGRKERLHDYLKMFKSVHALHDVCALRFIFFSAAGNAGILSQAGQRFEEVELRQRVFKCCEYVRTRGSPKGWTCP